MSSSSSPTTASTASSASASATSSGTSSGGGSSEPSSLYLFTFLATLFLLLFVSAAIVLRSFILRRRFRRRIEEALAAGVPLTPPWGGPPELFRILQRPKLWDLFLRPASKDGWKDTLPIAATVVASKPSHSGGSALSPHEGSPDASTSRFALLRRPFARRRATSTSPTASPNLSNPQPTDTSAGDVLPRAEVVQVAVMVMMPNPHRPVLRRNSLSISLKGKDKSLSGDWDEEEEEEGIPDVVLGLMQVPHKAMITGSPEL
ncbi:uncharacterized protein C8Q71DRAFT_737601 [Rhodofomes roseus]|uniref:Uncharacterized protein n=1 Tax=Rhodofomes roseus TaxID=34475 RepID=A0ABQ8KRW2_9APHY|nr:uncharacterized protein C8Q71DRAFT_737601 [Rhodofomes roseus]KAH9841550.1 hypothetical protein C8Q71DRAFT_737601 [Rhodofomes roseus]